MKRAQTSTEYIIILALVLLLAAIALATLAPIPTSGGASLQKANDLNAEFLDLGITEYNATFAGTSFYLQNNLPGEVQISQITIDGKLLYPQQDLPLTIQSRDKVLVKGYTESISGFSTVEISYTQGTSPAIQKQSTELTYEKPASTIQDGLVFQIPLDSRDPFQKSIVGDQPQGVQQGGTVQPRGKFGDGLASAVASDAIYWTEPVGLSTATATWSVWIRQKDTTLNQYFLGYGPSGSNRFLLRGDNNQRIRFYDDIANEGQTFTPSTGYTIQEDAWVHVVATFYSNGTKRLYVNGTYQGSDTTGSSLDSIATSSAEFTLSGLTPGTGHSLNGSLDEVMIWNKILTDEEIQAVYNFGNE